MTASPTQSLQDTRPSLDTHLWHAFSTIEITEPLGSQLLYNLWFKGPSSHKQALHLSRNMNESAP